jgi:hypothetical protein
MNIIVRSLEGDIEVPNIKVSRHGTIDDIRPTVIKEIQKKDLNSEWLL